jgi:predicted O-methyltransferase YrrM
MQPPSSRKFFKAIKYLFLTSSPLTIFISYTKTYFLKNKIINKSKMTGNSIKDKKFSTDWFSGNIPYWEIIFDKFNFLNKKISYLEIGSWEGRSSLFVLQSFSNANIVCVDTWCGADEHDGSKFLDSIESNFDFNLTKYVDRLQKFKGTSYSFFDQLDKDCQYDLIYIDGSHYLDDVLIDALKAFEHLKVGGVMIFDDYFWGYYEDSMLNPAAAINAFIRLKQNYLKVEMVYSQVIVSRTSNEVRINH